MIDRRTFLAAGAAGLIAPAATAAGRWDAVAPVPWKVQEVYGTAWRDKVVIAGGMAPGVVGLRGGINPQDRMGIYDPRANTWTEGPKLPFPRHHPVLATARSRVFAFGGYQVTEARGWVAVPDVLMMGGGGDWRPMTPMPKLQCETVAVTLGERIHIASGRSPKAGRNQDWNDQGDIDLHQVYDTGKWETARPCPRARNSATGAALNGLFYLAGGRRVGEGNSAQLDAYDPKTDTWTTLRPMPRAAGGLAGAALNGKLYVFGGEGGPGVIANAWSYDPATDQWTAEPEMATPRHGLAAVAVKGRIYAVGGGIKESGGQVSAIVEALTPV